MTAAELLRRLDAEATGGPWIVDGLRDGYVTGVDCNVCDQPGPAYDGYRAWPANARAICTTRNLLPLLAGLVEAVGRHEALMGMARRHGKQATMEAIMEARGGISAAYAALEAAAKEGVK